MQRGVVKHSAAHGMVPVVMACDTSTSKEAVLWQI